MANDYPLVHIDLPCVRQSSLSREDPTSSLCPSYRVSGWPRLQALTHPSYKTRPSLDDGTRLTTVVE